MIPIYTGVLTFGAAPHGNPTALRKGRSLNFTLVSRTALETPLNLLTRVRRLPWKLLLSPRRPKLGQADVLIGAGGFSVIDPSGRLYDPLFDSCREVFEGASYSVRMVSRLGEASAGRTFAAGDVVDLPIVERGRLLDAIVCRISNERLGLGCEKRAWNRVLDAVQPRVIVTFQPPPALCRAARLRNILIFDIQHGSIQENQEYYCTNAPVRADSSEWPTAILCWDANTVAIVNRVLEPHTRGHLVGHPWLSRFLEVRGDDTMVAAAVAHANEIRRSTSSPIVLITLQWPPGGDRTGLTGELLPAPLMEYLTRKSGVSWIVRPHPVQITESKGAIYARLTDDLQSVAGALPATVSQSLPLPAALGIAHAHITVQSSSVIEASWMGIPSWQFAPRPTLTDSLVQAGTDINALDSWLDQQLCRKRDRDYASGLASNQSTRHATSFAQRLLQQCRLSS